MIFVNEDGEFDGIVSTLKEHALRKAKNSRYHFFLKNICIIQTKSCCPHKNKCDQRSPLVYSIFYPGLFESLTQQLASALNFTSVRQLSFDGNWGGMFFNEQTQRMEWNGNIRMLMDNQSDMCATGMTMLKERNEVIWKKNMGSISCCTYWTITILFIVFWKRNKDNGKNYETLTRLNYGQGLE